MCIRDRLAVVLLSLLLIPASRHSFLHAMLGTSWETFLWAHRVLGYGMLLAVLGHMIAWYVKYHEVGLFPQEILNVPAAIPTCIDNFTVPLITLTTFVLLIAMGVFTLPVIRLSLIHISEPTRLLSISYAVFCLKKKKKSNK
eukprot:TRINITY_DN49635_c0_g1_i2.p1 TRINITY_DN49635_c0_g1~~TRINITY_DN49635_c0_g1_i2.p1  ORF type:complete len:142 (+),score=28.63 TRINITY_DN49635_c0_g1_i2:68-493(+)